MKLTEGMRLAVGSHEVTVRHFLLEGGFSQIYEVTMDPKEDDTDIGCLKQVIVPDKNGLTILRKEVDVMKTLAKASMIVKYYDSHAERLENGTYQVLVLMELCPNKSLLDYMNAHIREKLTEKAILKIMKDISLGIYEMHKLKMVHRDIKIENVLIDAHHDFKLCDFGSVASPTRPPKDQQEFQALSHDILYHTTPQYRAPEMIDLYRGFPIDEKSDIWALGCFLYKLCYYITPFETNGDIAILHASFQFPPAPVYSGDLKNLIIIMLQESPLYRPNIVQIIMLLYKMMGIEFVDLGIDDFYHAGEYNFQALHEMQRHKQNELLKQQQYYYEQQKQQQEFEAKQRETLAVRSLQDSKLSSNHGSVTDLNRRVLSRTPQPSSESILASNSQNSQHGKPSHVPIEQRASEAQNQLSLQSPVQMYTKSPQQYPQLSQSANSKLPGHAVPSQSSSAAHLDGKMNSISDTQQKAPTLSPELKSNKSVNSINSIVSIDSSDDSEVDINALGNLEDAENRYPSLDALDIALGGASTKSQEKGTIESPNTPKISIVNVSGSHVIDDRQTQPSKAPSEHHVKKPSQYEHIEAWQRLSASINKNAERLVEDIFVSRTTTNDPQAASKSGSHKSAGVSLESVDEVHFSEAKDSKPLNLNSPVVLPEKNKDSQKDKPSFLALSNQATLAVIGAPAPVVTPSLPGLAHVAGNLPGALPKSNPYSYQPAVLQELSSYVSHTKPFKEGKRESSNPWGDVLRKNDAVSFESMGRNSPFPNPDNDLSHNVLKLNLDDHPQPVSHKSELNLIELETGLSSSQSDLAPPLPSRPHEEVSLLDLGIDEDFTKKNNNKSMFKKKIADIQNQPIAFLEEVIDFASDDENNKSEMSRVAIRNSLRKSRKLSDHQHKRSDSSHAESRKRHSFFGGTLE